MATLPELLQQMVSMSGSDLHITTNTPPTVRVHGKLTRLDQPVLGPADTKQLAYSVLTDAQKKRFEETLELDFSFGIRGLARFRSNVFNQRGAVGAVYRLIPEQIKGFKELGLPPVLKKLRTDHPGIDLFISNAPTAAMVDGVLRNEIDLGLVTLPVEDSRLVVTPVRVEQMVAIFPAVARDIPKEVTPEYAAAQFLVLEFGAVSALIRSWMSAHGLAPRSPMILSGSRDWSVKRGRSPP